jgi:hypothetical protein
VGINPRMVARLITVASVKKKSSAVSVSSLLGLAGWDSAPSLPSGEPVLKKKESVEVGAADNKPTTAMVPSKLSCSLMAILLLGSCVWNDESHFAVQTGLMGWVTTSARTVFFYSVASVPYIPRPDHRWTLFLTQGEYPWDSSKTD